MRLLLLAPFFAATALLANAASADVGPPPKCAPGTHHVYHYGHHCEPDDAKAAAADSAKPPVDNAAATPTTPTASPSTSPAPVTSASPPPADSAAPPQVPAAPPADRGCACGIVATSSGAAGLVAAIAGLAALVRRRRSR